jgi:hypothetical protein
MRYATVPGWVYAMLIVMGIGFIGGSAGFMLFVPQPAGAIVGAIWVVMGAGFVFFSVRTLRGRRDDDRIRREGTAARATVLAARMTGMLVNNVPQWALRLRIDGAGASYETKLKVLTYTPPDDGTSMSVRVDPQRRDHVVLSDDHGTGADGSRTITASSVSVASGGGTPADTVRLLADLDRMRAEGSLSDAEFAAVKAKLLGT